MGTKMEDDKQKVADQHQNGDGKDVGDPNKASSRTIQVGNKIRRRGLYLKLKSEKKKDNLETREKLHQPVDNEGISNESSNLIEEEDEEVNWDLANDQFKDY